MRSSSLAPCQFSVEEVKARVSLESDACGLRRLISELVNESNYDGALRLGVLPNLCRQIKERNDYADCSDQLRQSVDRFQVHNAALSNQSRFYEVEMNGGGRGGIRTHGGFPHARFRVECLKPDSATLPPGETKTPNDQRPTSNIECNCLRHWAFSVGRWKLSVCIQTPSGLVSAPGPEKMLQFLTCQGCPDYCILCVQPDSHAITCC